MNLKKWICYRVISQAASLLAVLSTGLSQAAAADATEAIPSLTAPAVRRPAVPTAGIPWVIASEDAPWSLALATPVAAQLQQSGPSPLFMAVTDPPTREAEWLLTLSPGTKPIVLATSNKMKLGACAGQAIADGAHDRQRSLRSQRHRGKAFLDPHRFCRRRDGRRSGGGDTRQRLGGRSARAAAALRTRSARRGHRGGDKGAFGRKNFLGRERCQESSALDKAIGRSCGDPAAARAGASARRSTGPREDSQRGCRSRPGRSGRCGPDRLARAVCQLRPRRCGCFGSRRRHRRGRGGRAGTDRARIVAIAHRDGARRLYVNWLPQRGSRSQPQRRLANNACLWAERRGNRHSHRNSRRSKLRHWRGGRAASFPNRRHGRGPPAAASALHGPHRAFHSHRTRATFRVRRRPIAVGIN